MNNVYKGKPIEQWIELLLRKIDTLGEKTNDTSEVSDARSISFNSAKFKSKNVADALDESRGLVINQFDILKSKYKENLTAKQAFDLLFQDFDHRFNQGAIDIIGDVQQVTNKTEALDELLILALRLTLEIRNLNARLTTLENQPVNDRYSN